MNDGKKPHTDKTYTRKLRAIGIMPAVSLPRVWAHTYYTLSVWFLWSRGYRFPIVY